MDSWFKDDVLKGNVALVIGGSSESGPKVCSELVAHGSDIMFTYLHREAEANELAKRLRRHPARIECVPCDLLDLDTVMKLPSKVVETFGRVDIVVNLGGPPPIYTNLRDVTLQDIDTMIDAHFRANFILSLEAAKLMETMRGGTVINISATSSLKFDHGMYGLAKACQSESTGFLATTFAPKVKFFTIVPGLINNEEVDESLRVSRAEASPLKRNITAEEIAQLVITACSPAFTSITGQRIVADGGFFMLHP